MTIALVTGANRNIGLEVCRQLAQAGMSVLLGSRNADNGSAAAASLQAEGLDVQPLLLDVSSAESVAAASAQVPVLDVLVNNANVGFDWMATPSAVDLGELAALLDNNALGAWRTTQAFLPQLRASAAPRIVNVTSEAGSFGTPTGLGGHDGLSAYAIGKVVLNAFTVKLARELGEPFKVNAVSPGFVATTEQAASMGGRPVPEGAASIVWACTLGPDGPTGGLFRDGLAVPF